MSSPASKQHPASAAVITIARHAAGHVCLGGEPVAQDTAQAAYDVLLKEGRALKLKSPALGDTIRFLDRMDADAVIEIPRGDIRDTTVDTLSDARNQMRRTGVDGPTFYAWTHLKDLIEYQDLRGTSEKPLVIAFDLDGCLYNFNSVMREWLASRGWERAAMPEPDQYYTQHAWKIDNKVFQTEMKEALRAGVMFRTGMAMRDGVHTARYLGLLGHTVLINTARNFTGLSIASKSATVQWLRENGVHPDKIHLADPVKSEDKLAEPFDLLIDDHPGNVKAALDAGRSAVLLDRPWNHIYLDLPRASYAEISADPYKFLRS